MKNKLYIGNLPFDTTDRDLQDLFSQAGPVREVLIITDKMTGRSRGFAFVTMEDDASADAAISQFNGRDIGGRSMTVNVARKREERGGSGGGRFDKRPSGGQRQSRRY